jgi:hypothetical protein
MKNADLEKKILDEVRQVKYILNGQATLHSEEEITSSMDKYRTKDGKSLYELAQENNRSIEEFQEKKKYFAGKKYSLLHALNSTLDGLENTILGATGPGIGLDKIAMKLEGRTTLLPVLLVVYSVHKLVDDIGAQWLGVYSTDLKGRASYSLDELIRQTKFLGKLAGVGSIVERISPNFEKRIEKAAIRDMEYWIKTGKDPEQGYKADVEKLISYTRGKVFEIEDRLADYHERHVAYGTDHLPAQMTGYQRLQPVPVPIEK